MVSKRELRQISREVYSDLTTHYKYLKETRKRKGVGKTPSSFPKECSKCDKEVKLAYMVYHYKRKGFVCVDCYMKYVNSNIQNFKKKKIEFEKDIDSEISGNNNKQMRTGDPELDSFLNDYLQASSKEKKEETRKKSIQDEVLEDIDEIKKAELIRKTTIKKFKF